MTDKLRSSLHMAAASLVIMAGSGTAAAQSPWDWTGGRADDRQYGLEGVGVPHLYPELRRTNRGRAFVMRNFDRNRDGRVNRREAEAANRAFAEVAGPPRDRFDWDARDRVVIIEQQGGSGWDRRAMRDYDFRQSAQGATMTMQEDVLFRTNSDVLRPGAADRLLPLARYLRANPGVRVAIIGHTDSRGSDVYNQDLAERRAESVREGLADMGVTRARFRVTGRGEREPVASNATPNGMRLNRRVEVTLLGQRVDRFLDDE